MAEISRTLPGEYVRILSAPMGDPQITAAALLGLGEARYRTDDDAGALANWQSVTQLPEIILDLSGVAERGGRTGSGR